MIYQRLPLHSPEFLDGDQRSGGYYLSILLKRCYFLTFFLTKLNRIFLGASLGEFVVDWPKMA